LCATICTCAGSQNAGQHARSVCKEHNAQLIDSIKKSSFTYSFFRHHLHITSSLSRARVRDDFSIDHECLACPFNDLFAQQCFVSSLIDMAALLSVNARNMSFSQQLL